MPSSSSTGANTTTTIHHQSGPSNATHDLTRGTSALATSSRRASACQTRVSRQRKLMHRIVRGRESDGSNDDMEIDACDVAMDIEGEMDIDREMDIDAEMDIDNNEPPRESFDLAPDDKLAPFPKPLRPLSTRNAALGSNDPYVKAMFARYKAEEAQVRSHHKCNPETLVNLPHQLGANRDPDEDWNGLVTREAWIRRASEGFYVAFTDASIRLLAGLNAVLDRDPASGTGSATL